jgi:hypothetical protein
MVEVINDLWTITITRELTGELLQIKRIYSGVCAIMYRKIIPNDEISQGIKNWFLEFIGSDRSNKLILDFDIDFEFTSSEFIYKNGRRTIILPKENFRVDLREYIRPFYSSYIFRY